MSITILENAFQFNTPGGGIDCQSHQSQILIS